nr:hypothetical protein [Tanacetum cinerariifolium]
LLSRIHQEQTNTPQTRSTLQNLHHSKVAESSSHKSPSPKIKKELVILDKPESPNPFLPVTQVDFIFNEIAFTTNNEVALIYPSHANQEYFIIVSDFISKYCLKEAFIRAPTQYKEYLSEFWYIAKTLDNSKVKVSTPTGRVRREIGITTFRNALKEHYIPHSTMYVPPPFTTTVRPWFATIRYTREIRAKGTLKRSGIPPRWRLLIAQIINHMKAICNLVVPVDSKAPKPSSQDEKVPKAKILELQLDSEEKSSLAKNKSPSHPSPPIPMVGKMHKEAQQAASGPTSLGATSKEGAHPQLSSDSKAKANPGLSSLNDYIPPQQGLKTVNTKSGASKALGADEISKKIKLEDLADILKDTRSSFFTLDSLTDEPIIISDMSEEEENVENDKDTEDTLVPPLSPN